MAHGYCKSWTIPVDAAMVSSHFEKPTGGDLGLWPLGPWGLEAAEMLTFPTAFVVDTVFCACGTTAVHLAATCHEVGFVVVILCKLVHILGDMLNVIKHRPRLPLPVLLGFAFITTLSRKSID